MRVLHVNTFLYRRGGAEAYMLGLGAPPGGERHVPAPEPPFAASTGGSLARGLASFGSGSGSGSDSGNFVTA